MAHPQSNHAHVHAWMTTPMAYQRSRVDRAVMGLSMSEPAYDFQPQDPEEWELKHGDIITVLDKKILTGGRAMRADARKQCTPWCLSQKLGIDIHRLIKVLSKTLWTNKHWSAVN